MYWQVRVCATYVLQEILWATAVSRHVDGPTAQGCCVVALRHSGIDRKRTGVLRQSLIS